MFQSEKCFADRLTTEEAGTPQGSNEEAERTPAEVPQP